MAENKLFTTILKKEINDDEMSVVAWANKSDSIDRSGDLIDDEAWDLTNFLKNPVIPAFHMYNRPPVGRAMWAKVVPGQGLRFKVKFANTDEGREFYQLFKDGVMNAFSVGFMPRDVMERDEFGEEEIKKYMRDGRLPERVYKSVELFEISAVVVPDHMNALVERSNNGMIKTKTVQEFVDFVKKSPEYIELKESEEKIELEEESAKIVGHMDIEDGGPDSENKDVETEEKESESQASDEAEEKEFECEQEGEHCYGDECPEYDDCQEPYRKESGSVVEEKTEDLAVDEAKTEDDESKSVDSMEEVKTEKLVNILLKEINKQSDEIKRYIDESIEEKLKFFQQNADKDINENSETIDFEIKEEKVEIDFDPEDVKEMIRKSISTVASVKKELSELVDERIKRAKGQIF